MALIKWDPFQDMITIEERVKRLLSSSFPELRRESGRPQWPSIDVSETQNEVIVRAELPGVKCCDISLQIHGRTILVLKGEEDRTYPPQSRGRSPGRVC